MENKSYTLKEVRTEIDRIDLEIIKLLALRSSFVKKAASLKSSIKDVKAPDRVRKVLEKSRVNAAQYGMDPDIAEKVYRAITGAFIQKEKKDYKKIKISGEDNDR